MVNVDFGPGALVLGFLQYSESLLGSDLDGKLFFRSDRYGHCVSAVYFDDIGNRGLISVGLLLPGDIGFVGQTSIF